MNVFLVSQVIHPLALATIGKQCYKMLEFFSTVQKTFTKARLGLALRVSFLLRREQEPWFR